MEIDKKALEHLAELARIELGAEEQEKLLKDLGNIIGYVEELKALDTSNVEPMAGGTTLVNAFRDDESGANTNQGKGVEAFPKAKDGFLKIPPVFE
jgi:aspartyl-tRNA(Asn)/glutamyl-tRNA(Gln) amidotransferase subunit C